MAIKISKVESRRDLMKFIKFPWKIYKNDPNWVPPLIFERVQHLTPKNPFFKYGKAQYFLAWKDGELVGRISAHLNPLHNQRYNDKVGFWGFFESIDDQEVANALFEAAEEWLKEHGMDRSRGPMSFTINDEVGLLIEGFDTPPKILMGHNPPYYPRLVENAGYKKIKDLYAWDYLAGEIPPIALKAAEQARKIEGLTIREVDPSKIDKEVRIVVDVFNSAWSENWGFVPFTEDEIKKFAEDLKLLLDPRLALIAEYKGEPVAISIALPDLNQMIKDLNGRLFPFGFIKLLWRVKRRKYTDARLLLLGIKKEYRGQRLGRLSVLLYVEMHKRAKQLGLRGGELGWTLEDNEKINRGIELMGGKLYKKYRVYEKEI